MADLESGGGVPGRLPLSRLALAAGLSLSPAMVRSRLESLAVRGFVVSSRGRRGSRISNAGKMAIENG